MDEIDISNWNKKAIGTYLGVPSLPRTYPWQRIIATVIAIAIAIAIIIIMIVIFFGPKEKGSIRLCIAPTAGVATVVVIIIIRKAICFFVVIVVAFVIMIILILNSFLRFGWPCGIQLIKYGREGDFLL